ncbi:MAG: sensor histidine kinase [Novosphingobium sp.]|uniref:sensor histidine kinase n=1 Tax=Novosphingobium sp. TaxID=1874826 RepID=UPI003B9C2F82
MNRTLTASLVALAAVAAVTAVTVALLPTLGLASASLLFLLPVLLGAARGGLGPGLVAALAGTAAYNFFLLEPRYTFRVHQIDNLVSMFVLGAVAIVTSRLATRLLEREAEANARARTSAEAAALATILSADPPDRALHDGVAFLSDRYGAALLLDEPTLGTDDAALSPVDRSAAAWALHNGDVTGHGTETMAAAEWTFIPIHPRSRSDQIVLALSRPSNGTVQSAEALDHVGQLCQLLGQCRDRASLAQERRSRELAEAKDRLRQTLLASLAHDFRTPLTVITGRLELLAAQRHDAQDALQAARRLDRMMADLLGAARIEDGTLVAVTESIDLVDVVAAALDGSVPPAGIAIVQDIPADLPFIEGDPVLLLHVFANLIDNALRHASATIAIRARAQGDLVMIAIEDDGPGIPLAESERLFERFARIEGSDRTEGSGLGLAIVRGFADAMGMTVTITKGQFAGACFTIAAHARPVAPV